MREPFKLDPPPVYDEHYAATQDDDGPVYIDIERMERALAGPRFTVPNGLTHEERRQFIRDCAAGKITPDARLAEAPAPLTCWGLSSFCAEDGHKCRAAGKCVYTPPPPKAETK